MVTVGKKGVTCLLCIIQYQPMGFVVAGIIYPKAVGEPGRSTAILRVLTVPHNKLSAGGINDQAEGASQSQHLLALQRSLLTRGKGGSTGYAPAQTPSLL